MPYKSVYMKPEVFLTWGKIKIFHTYKNDDWDDRLYFWFTFSEDISLDEDEHAFHTGEIIDRRGCYREQQDGFKNLRKKTRKALKEGLLDRYMPAEILEIAKRQRDINESTARKEVS